MVLAAGGIIEYTAPTPIANGASCFGCGQASLGGIVAGGDGNLWFVDSGRYKVGRITPSGVITEFDIPANVGGPYGIGSGPDGNIWVTTNNLGQGRQDWILRVTPDGTVNSFQAGTGVGFSGSGPESITTGPDGNLWFTEFWTNRIGRMTPEGSLIEFPISGADTAPRGIVSGPDGNVWFVESHFNHTAIARITLAGVVTEYPLGGSSMDQLQPTNIVLGPDGNLWFSEAHPSAPQGEVGRITPDGTVTWFPFPPGGRPYGLASGPDGNIWVGDSGKGTIVRMSPTGAIRPFPLARYGTQPGELTAGPDGRMWFTEGGGRIGSIGVTVPEAVLSARVLNFGTANSRELTINNTGDAPLHIKSAAVVGPDQAQFVIAADDCSRRAVGVNGTCHIGVTFKAGSDARLKAARLTLTDDATGSPHSVSLVAQLPDCKLPLFAGTSSALQGEFLRVRTGQVIADPNGGFTIASGARTQSEANPVLHGQPQATFDSAAGRWVPAPANWISPDGARYAYVDYPAGGPGGQVHVVDVGSGRDRTLPLQAGFWTVLAFAQEGIYVHQSYEGIGPGLWLVNPESGAMTTIFTDAVVYQVFANKAWIGARDNSDPSPGPPGIGGNNNEVQSRDLTTLQTTTWLYKSGFNLFVVGAANGSIVVQGYDNSGVSVWVLRSPGQAQPMTVPGTNDAVSFSRAPAADAIGWWMGGGDGLYLWTDRTGAFLVSEVTADPAGACA